MKNYLLLALSAVALLFAFCKKNDPDVDKPMVVAVTGVSLNTNAVTLEVDDSVTLTATVAPDDATNKAVSWSSADDAIATVKDGVVTAVAAGETTVTVTTVDGDFKATANVVVNAAPIKVTGVMLDKPSLELEVGDSDTLTATVAPDDATNKAVSWSSADDAIATVEDGVVTAVAAGETTVTVTTVDGDFKATANVVVKAAPIKVTGVSLNTDAVALEVDDSITLTATVAPTNATNKGVEWSVADDAIATVKDGVVTAVAIGETTVTVTTVDGGFTASATITVAEGIIKVTGVTLNKPSLELEIGDSDTLTATVAPDDATNKAVSWSSANDAIATVEDGVVTAVAAGETTVTVTTADGGFTASATITVAEGIIKVTGVTLDKPSLELEVGDSDTLTATVAPDNATNKAVSWSSANDAIATVEDGVVTAVAAGETTVTVTTADGAFKATANVVVKAAPIKVTGVSLDKTMVSLEIGESVTVEATVTPETAVNKAVEWSIADTAVATVSNGVVTGVAEGETTLTVTTVDGGHTATIPVKVVTEKVAVTGIRMPTNSSIEIKEGQESMCIVEVLPANATDVSVKWSSSDEKVATVTPYMVNQNAVAVYIKGVGGGTATITATTNDGGFEASCDVTVISIVKVTSIEVTPSPCSVEEGNTLQLKATVSPNDAENKEIEWSSSNTAVATVDANGLVTGVAQGEVTITATAKDGSGVKGIATITVIVPPTSVTFDGKTDQAIYTWWGKEVDLKAEVTPEGVSLKHLTWVWNDPNASSNPDGLKYNVTDDKATLTYTWPSQTSRLRGVNVRAFYGNGNTVYAEADVYFQTFAHLLTYSEDAINYEGSYPLTQDFDYKWNWDNKESNKFAFIAYYRSNGSENARPDYYKEYYIPTSEYTLTSSDPSKVKVTKSADGESWEIERLNTTDLVAVTLTYKCGNHTETYTLNLIP